MVHITLINGAEMRDYKNTQYSSSPYNQIVKLHALINVFE